MGKKTPFLYVIVSNTSRGIQGGKSPQSTPVRGLFKGENRPNSSPIQRTKLPSIQRTKSSILRPFPRLSQSSFQSNSDTKSRPILVKFGHKIVRFAPNLFSKAFSFKRSFRRREPNPFPKQLQSNLGLRFDPNHCSSVSNECK